MPHPSNRHSGGTGLLGLSCLGCGLITAAGVGGLVVIGVIVAVVGGLRVREAAALKDSPPAQVEVPAKKAASKSELEQLLDAHRANEADARRKYTGAPLTVSGVVKSTDRHVRAEQGGFVMLGQVEGITSVAANFKPGDVDQAMNLRVGDRVTIRGKYGNGSMLKEGFVLILTHSELVSGP